MCGRFYVDPDDTEEELLALYERLQAREQQRNAAFTLKVGEICPGDTAAVLALNRSRVPSIFAMRWGFRMDKRLVFNARSETAAQRPMFRESMQLRRCLIPASAYFEWDHREPKPVKYRFAAVQHAPLYLAGLYRLEPEGAAFTILTREAAPEISMFHDRMPVIASGAAKDAWLDQAQSPEFLLNDPLTALSWTRA